MENRGLGNGQGPYFSASFSPESQTQNFSSLRASRNSLPEVGLENPQIPYGFSGDQTLLESALSRLSLSSNFQRQTTAPLPPLAAIAEGMAVQEAGPWLGYGYPFNSGDQELSNVGLQGELMGLQNFGGQSLGFAGAHRNLMVGPDPWDCGPGAVSGSNGGIFREPWGGEESALLNMELNNVDNSQWFNEHGYSYLQHKQSMSRTVNAQFPSLPSNQNGLSSLNLDAHGLSRLNLDAHVNGLAWKYSSTMRPNSHNNRQTYARNKHPLEGISLQDLRGRIVLLSKDQSGSKILQAKLDEPNEEGVEMVLCEVIDHVADLMKNPSGSYFVQKLFGICSEEQRTRIIVAVTRNSFQLVDVCLNFNGARTMQKLLENLSTPEQISLVISALCPGGVALANDPNGQHVIRYCLIHYPYEYHKHLLNEIANNCCRIATDKSGCCVLQSCVEHANGEPKERLIKEIISNALLLAEDPYGNYVVQHLLGLKMPHVTALLLGQLKGHFVSLSSDKYGSNVVEKFLVEAGKEHSTTIIMEMLMSPNADSLLVHPYGNFVIQKALSIARGDVYDILCHLIERNAPSMRSNLFGRKILAWFEKKKHQHVA